MIKLKDLLFEQTSRSSGVIIVAATPDQTSNVTAAKALEAGTGKKISGTPDNSKAVIKQAGASGELAWGNKTISEQDYFKYGNDVQTGIFEVEGPKLLKSIIETSGNGIFLLGRYFKALIESKKISPEGNPNRARGYNVIFNFNSKTAGYQILEFNPKVQDSIRGTTGRQLLAMAMVKAGMISGDELSKSKLGPEAENVATSWVKRPNTHWVVPNLGNHDSYRKYLQSVGGNELDNAISNWISKYQGKDPRQVETEALQDWQQIQPLLVKTLSDRHKALYVAIANNYGINPKQLESVLSPISQFWSDSYIGGKGNWDSILSAAPPRTRTGTRSTPGVTSKNISGGEVGKV